MRIQNPQSSHLEQTIKSKSVYYLNICFDSEPRGRLKIFHNLVKIAANSTRSAIDLRSILITQAMDSDARRVLVL